MMPFPIKLGVVTLHRMYHFKENYMWSILIVLLIGMLIGAFANLSEKFIKINGKLQHIGVIILLFAMGASLGLNKELLSKISDIGLIALVFAVLTTLFSILLTFYVTKLYMKGKE